MDFNLDDNAINEIMDLIRGLEMRLTNELNQINDLLGKNKDLLRKNSDLIQISERRTQCFILNSQIKDTRQKIVWPPNYDGIEFSGLSNGNRVGNIPANIDAIKNSDVQTIDAILTHYDIIPQRQRSNIEEKRAIIFQFLGVQIY